MWEKKNTENKKFALFFSIYFNAVKVNAAAIFQAVANSSAEMPTVPIPCWFVLDAALTFNCEGFTGELTRVLLRSAKLVKTAYKKVFQCGEKKPSCLVTRDTVGIPDCRHLH